MAAGGLTRFFLSDTDMNGTILWPLAAPPTDEMAQAHWSRSALWIGQASVR